MRHLRTIVLGALIFITAFAGLEVAGTLYMKYYERTAIRIALPQLASAQFTGPFDPVLGTVVATVSAAANTTLTQVLVTPTAPLVSNTSEVMCNSAVQGGSKDQYAGAWISANNPTAGSPPNYIVMLISNANAGNWRCVVFEHPY